MTVKSNKYSYFQNFRKKSVSMCFLCRFVVVVSALGFFGLTMPVVKADLFLDGFGSVTWDRGGVPFESQAITFAVTPNSDLNAVNRLNAFGVGLRIVPQIGAAGTLNIGTPVKANANSIFADFSPALFVTYPVFDVPTVNGNNQPATDVTLITGKNLFDLTFTSMDAYGAFEIYAVPEFTSYFPSDEFDGLKFVNVAGPADTLLGTINVNISTVPEPSSAVACLSMAFIATVVFMRRRRRPATQGVS